MSIKAYKGRQIQRSNGLPIIARIYKGESKEDAKKAGRKFPQDLNYFRVEFEQDNPMFNPQETTRVFNSIYGETPSVLHGVQFIADKIETALTSSFEEWSTSGKGNSSCLTRCDGENRLLWTDNAGQHRDPAPCLFNPNAKKPMCGCKAVGRLTFWLPQFTKQSGVLGTFMLVTHSINDIVQMQSSLETALAGMGRLSQVAFVLYRKNTAIKDPQGLPINKSLIYLELGTAGAQALALQATNENPLLSAPPTVSSNDTRTDDFGTEDLETGRMLIPVISIARSGGSVLYRLKDADDGAVYYASYKQLTNALPDENFNLLPDETVKRLTVNCTGFNALVRGDEVVELTNMEEIPY